MAEKEVQTSETIITQNQTDTRVEVQTHIEKDVEVHVVENTEVHVEVQKEVNVEYEVITEVHSEIVRSVEVQEVGITGPQGAKGDKGDKGDPGVGVVDVSADIAYISGAVDGILSDYLVAADITGFISSSDVASISSGLDTKITYLSGAIDANTSSIASNDADISYISGAVYNKSESDSRFVDITGDTMIGTLAMSGAGIQLDTNYTPPHSEGLFFYDPDDKCLTYYNEQNDMAVQVGQEEILRVVNKTGSLISNGEVVFIDGAQGNRPTVALADKTIEYMADATIGLATHDIPNNQNGYITTFGLVRSVDTSGFGAGDTLWLGSNGSYTNIRPEFPFHSVEIGHVVIVDGADGAILVNVKNGTHLERLHDVSISGAIDGDIISWSSGISGWTNDYNIASVISDITSLSGAVNIINSDVIYLSGAIDINSANIAANDADISYISGQVSSNDTDIANLESDVIYLSGAIDSNASNIASNDADISYISGEVDSISGRVVALETISEDTLEPTGIVDTNETSVLTIDEANRVVTVTPSAGGLELYVRGNKFTFTDSISASFSDVEGNHFFVVDASGNFSGLTAASISAIHGCSVLDYILVNNAFVTEIYWDATNNKALLFDERHGCVMDAATHYNLHISEGTRYITGLVPGDILADDTGSSDSHAQFSTTAGSILDEDINTTINARSISGDITVLYKEGPGDWRWNVDSAPIITSGTGRAAYNLNSGGTWSLSEIGNNNFVLAHVFGSPIKNNPAIFAIIGQTEYSNIVTAREGAADEIANLITSGLAMPEFVPIATIIYQSSNAYSNTWKSRIRTTDSGDDYINWLGTNNFTSAGAATTHNNLGGLQGGTAGEYFHLSSADYADRIGRTEVASISSGLDSRITFNDADIAYISGQVDSITVPTSADFLSDYDSRFVNITGDTMTGDLAVHGTSRLSRVIAGECSGSNQIPFVGTGGRLQGSTNLRAFSDGTLYTTNHFIMDNDYIQFRRDATGVNSSWRIDPDYGGYENKLIFEARSDGASLIGIPFAMDLTGAVTSYRDFQIDTLTKPNSGNFLTWNEEGILVDSGFSESDIIIPDIFRAEVAGISAGLDGRITAIESDYLTSSSISDFVIRSEIASATGELQSQIDSNDTDISNLDSDVAYLSGAIDTNTTNIATNASDIADIFAALPGSYVTLFDDLTDTPGSKVGAQNYFVTVDGASLVYTDFRGEVQTLSGSLQSQINSNNADIDYISGRVDSHTHSYLPLSGGTLTGTLFVDNIEPVPGGAAGMSIGKAGEEVSVPGTLSVANDISVGGTVDGRDIAADGSKLDTIESGATGDQTAGEILTAIKTVDGDGSGLDTDLIQGSDAQTVIAGLRANCTLIGGGILSVSSTGYVKNSSRILSLANGRGSHYSTQGYFDINIPTSGTVTGVGGAVNKTATSDGVPLDTWEALYYILPIGSIASSLDANFRVVKYTSDLEIPAHWVRIVTRESDGTNRFNWYNGIILSLNSSVNTDVYDSHIAYFATGADTLDGIDSTGFKRQNELQQVSIITPDGSSGSWTTASSSNWGNPKFQGTYNEYAYTDTVGGYLEWNVPSGMKTFYFSGLAWSSGGYVDVYGIESDGGAVLMRRVNTRNTKENTFENPNWDGPYVAIGATGLDHYAKVRIINRSGRFHLTGATFTSNDLESTDGLGLTHWGQMEGLPTTIAGYGITDAYTESEINSLLTNYVPYSNASNVDFVYNTGVFWDVGVYTDGFYYPSAGNLQIRVGSTTPSVSATTTNWIHNTGVKVNGNITIQNGNTISVTDTLTSADDTDELLIRDVSQSGELKKITKSNLLSGVGGGPWELIGTPTEVTVSSSSVDLTLPAGYSAFHLIISDMTVTADGFAGFLRVSDDGGSTFDAGAGHYAFAGHRYNSAGSGGNLSGTETGVNICHFGIGNAAQESYSASILITNPRDSGERTKVIVDACYIDAGGNTCQDRTANTRVAAQADDAIRIVMFSGNIDGGTFTLLGLKE